MFHLNILCIVAHEVMNMLWTWCSGSELLPHLGAPLLFICLDLWGLQMGLASSVQSCSVLQAPPE